MEEETKNPKPDYTGNLQVAGWIKKDKNGNEYISVKISQFVNLFTAKKEA